MKNDKNMWKFIKSLFDLLGAITQLLALVGFIIFLWIAIDLHPENTTEAIYYVGMAIICWLIHDKRNLPID